MRTTLTALTLALYGLPSFAADVPGSHDLENLPRFAQAHIVEFQQTDGERLYPQGAISRISGRLRMENEVRVNGQATRITYELPVGHTADEAFTQARKALAEQGALPLHWCKGRECGASNLLANAVFGNARLYGPDDQQSYLLMLSRSEQADAVIALYGITRGNRRAYLHVEQVLSQAPLDRVLPSPQALLRQLKDAGKLSLPELSEDSVPQWQALLVRTLRLEAGLRVELAGAHAAAWRQALVEQGVRAARLDASDSPEPGLKVSLLR